MPFKDGTGPRGEGPMTGRGRGDCTGRWAGAGQGLRGGRRNRFGMQRGRAAGQAGAVASEKTAGSPEAGLADRGKESA